MLVDRQEAILLRRHGHAVGRVQVDDAACVLAVHMQRRMDREACGVYRERRVHHLVALHVDLHQRRGGDLFEQKTVGIDQEVVLRTRHAGGDVGEHHIVPAVNRDQPIGGCEILANRPFLGTNLVFYGLDV